MTFELFGSDDELVPLVVEDASIWFVARIALPTLPEQILQELIAATPWKAESVTVWGKTHLQPRLIAWYGDRGQRYSYSGIELEPLPWTPLLKTIRSVVQKLSHENFNSVLLNYYRDHRDSMGFHSDNERELGPTPTIASLSLGANRTLVLKHKARLDLKPIHIELPSGSLLVMKGQTQRFWKHGINKQARPCGPRINLTFRRIMTTTV